MNRKTKREYGFCFDCPAVAAEGRSRCEACLAKRRAARSTKTAPSVQHGCKHCAFVATGETDELAWAALKRHWYRRHHDEYVEIQRWIDDTCTTTEVIDGEVISYTCEDHDYDDL